MMKSHILFLCILTVINAEYSTVKVLSKFYSKCASKTDFFKCLKIQSLKIMDRAVHAKMIGLTNGVSLVSDRQSRELKVLNSTALEELSSEEVDQELVDATGRFFGSHRLQIHLPSFVEEGRKKDGNKGGGWGGMMWALAIKGTFLAMAYQGIAVMSGTAILVGKLALLLSAILGLKKLTSHQEKTTFEIVKIPKHVESHSHSTSFEDDGYHRSFDELRGNTPYRL